MVLLLGLFGVLSHVQVQVQSTVHRVHTVVRCPVEFVD